VRPKTLAEVAQLTFGGGDFDHGLANFLDEFKVAPCMAAFSAVPALLAPRLGDIGGVRDAYLAATAEHLAYSCGWPTPAWAFADERKLRRPWFASKLAALRAVLILESPAAFRSRNLFVSENALHRA
jgi:hypothetical protein